MPMVDPVQAMTPRAQRRKEDQKQNKGGWGGMQQAGQFPQMNQQYPQMNQQPQMMGMQPQQPGQPMGMQPQMMGGGGWGGAQPMLNVMQRLGINPMKQPGMLGVGGEGGFRDTSGYGPFNRFAM